MLGPLHRKMKKKLYFPKKCCGKVSELKTGTSIRDKEILDVND